MNLLIASCVLLSTLTATVYGQNTRIYYGGRNDADDLVLGTMVGDQEPDIPQLLQELGLTALIDSLNTAALTDALVQNAPLTVFGPTNQAFSRLMPWTRNRLRNTTVLSRTLQYHVVAGLLFQQDLANEMLLDTLLGKPLRINVYPQPRAPSVYTAQCNPIVTTSSSQNGVVHTVGKVLLPPYGDMLTSLSACPVFRNLTTAMRMVGLDEIVSGPYTLFAPTDYVFQRTYPEGVDALFRDRSALRDMLLSHVVTGTQCSAGFQDGTPFQTLSGRRLVPEVTQTGIKVNGVTLTSKDAGVTNGVIHCVQSLLWP